MGKDELESSRPWGSIFVSLRNYKLHLDQVEDLQLDAAEIATSIADAMAVLHWHTMVDSMDVEFVLGSSPTDEEKNRWMMSIEAIQQLVPKMSTFEHVTNSRPDFTKRLISLWLIDFDACEDITMDGAGVRKAVRAFIEKEPGH